MLRAVDSLSVLRSRPKRLLAVFAHPDDEAYGAAGVLARAGACDATAAVLLTLTNGEASTVMAAEGLDREAVARKRSRRMEAVAERLGLDGLLLPGLPDGALAEEPLARLGDVVGEAIDAFAPQVVIAVDPRGVNGHPDNIASHWAVRRALEGRAPRRLAQLVYLQETADAVKPRLLFPVPETAVDAVIRLDASETDAKEDCLRIHDALATVKEDGPEDLLYRPPIERFDFLGKPHDPPLGDLFG